jgi:hypothetical protein
MTFDLVERRTRASLFDLCRNLLRRSSSTCSANEVSTAFDNFWTCFCKRRWEPLSRPCTSRRITSCKVRMPARSTGVTGVAGIIGVDGTLGIDHVRILASGWAAASPLTDPARVGGAALRGRSRSTLSGQNGNRPAFAHPARMLRGVNAI